MSDDEVRTTYNAVGRFLMEAMYSQDYLSIGGQASTDALAAAAGLNPGCRVLDVGSGLGGPSLRLAERYRAQVTGLDLVEDSVREANQRAAARGLDDLVDFRVGDATAMPFEAASFDVVWGQDAWCHVPDKDRLIAEAARVLSPGGTIAFTDWLQVGEMTVDEEQVLLSAIASPDIATLDVYRGWLAALGFTLDLIEDISTDFVQQYREVVARLEGMEGEIESRFGPKVTGIVLEKNRHILAAFEAGRLGGGKIVATKA